MAGSDRAVNRTGGDRDKSLETALAQIERQFGRGSIMRLGDEGRAPIEVIPTGAIALDVALGIGGLPRGRVVEIYGPEGSGKTTLALHAVANAQKAGGIAAFIDAEHALDPEYAKKLGVDTDGLLVSQPDTGEQALEIADMLIRSGAIDVVVIDSVAALVPRAEIEGEMGDSHVGLQARLMSQALRKITGALSQTKTTAIFINQLREKVGVMFGCMSYATRVTLADGTQEKIGKIVNQRQDVEVLSYDPESGRIVPRRVVNWFNNGRTERFLQFTVAKSGGNGKAQFAATENHLVQTPGGWREAGELIPGDRVALAEPWRLSGQQMELILGALMGDGSLSPNPRGRSGTRFRMGHGAKQAAYLDWKASLLGNIGCALSSNAKGAVFADLTPLPELAELREAVYFGDGKKHLSWEYLKALTPFALAVWYMDDGCFTVRSKGVQERTQGGTGRIEICVQAMSPGSRERLADYLRDTHQIDVRVVTRGSRRQAILQFTTAASEKFQKLVAPYIHPSMEYKLLPRFRGQFRVEPEFVPAEMRLVPARILDIHVKPPTRSMNRFDIEVEGSHNYFVDGVMVHNSPETTSGGRALKFYASVRLDVRRIETLKDGTEAVGSRTRIKVVKNKCSPPFKVAECDIIFGTGISREGGLIDLGVEQSIVRKSGAWYTYEGDQLGQGKENSRNFLRDNPDLANEIEKKIKEKLGVGPRLDAEAAPANGAGTNGSAPSASAAGAPAAGAPVGRAAAARARAGLRARRMAQAAVPDRPATKRRAASRSSARAGTAAAGMAGAGTAGPGTGAAVAGAGSWAGQTVRDPEEQARQLCLRLLTGRPRTRAQLAEAMQRRGIPDAAAARSWPASEVGLIDDAAFARAWVESRHHGRGLARRALSAELRQRGVDGQDISTAVSALDPADEIATARRLVAKGLAASRGKPLPTRVRRLVGLLARKGYPAPIAYRVVREALDQEGADAAAAGIDLDDMALTIADGDADPAEAHPEGPFSPEMDPW